VLLAYAASVFLVLELRDGTVPRVGAGEPARFSAAGTSGGARRYFLPEAEGGPRGGAHMHALEPADDPRMYSRARPAPPPPLPPVQSGHVSSIPPY